MITLITGYNLESFIGKVDYYMPFYDKHPEKQSDWAYNTTVMSRGKNIRIATHSDHILNGIRRAVYDDNELEVNIVFYDKEGKITVLTMDGNGRIDNCPKGFFDQIDKDLGYLLE